MNEEKDITGERPDSLIRLKRRSRLLTLLTVVLFLVLVVVSVLPSALGFAVTRILQNAASRGMVECEISQIGLFRANAAIVAKVKDGKRNRTLFSLPDCRLTYTPLSLLFGKLNGIVITGATVRVTCKDGVWSLPAAELFTKKTEPKNKPEEKSNFSIPTRLPLDLDYIQFKNALVSLNMDDRTQFIPISGTIRADRKNLNRITFCSVFQAGGQPVLIRGAYCGKPGGKGSAEAEVILNRFRLDNLPYPLAAYADSIGLSGETDLKFKSAYDFDMDLLGKTSLELAVRNFTVSNIHSRDLRFDFQYADGSGTLNVKDLNFGTSFQLKEMESDFKWTREKGVDGKLGIRTPEDTGTDIHCAHYTIQNAEKPKNVRMNIRPIPRKEAAIRLPGGLYSDFSAVHLLINCSLQNPGFSAEIENLLVQAREWNIFLPTIHLNARYSNQTLNGKLYGLLSKASMPKEKLEIKDAVFSIPFRQGTSESGILNIGEITYNGKREGALETALKLALSKDFAKNSLDLQGRVHLSGVPALVPEFKSINRFGKIGFLSSNEIRIPETALPETSLAFLGPQYRNMNLAGKIKLNAKAILESGRPLRGDVLLNLSGMSLKDDTKQLSVTGGSLDFIIPNLAEIRTSPGLQASVGTLRAGNFSLSDFQMIYRMENPHLWTVEKIRTKWADGTVRLEATRFDLKEGALDLTLHCDRIKLSEIFRQFGKGYAEGDGTMSGTIPVAFKEGKVLFQEGFLNSTPGVQGVLKLSGTELLTAGVPKSSPYHAQLEFSQEVLKDFSYEWAKLNFNGRDDVLQLQMQLNGKPLRPLPFRYENGRFFKTDSRAHFSGVRLDVNFSIPLTRLIPIAEKIQKIAGDLKK